MGLEKLMKNNEYLYNWSDFVCQIAELFNEGASEKEISQAFSGSKITWVGKIADIKLKEKYSPGVAMNMVPAHTQLGNNKVLRSDYLFLRVSSVTENSWATCNIGDVVRFNAVISKVAGPFPEIQLSVSENDPEVLLMMGLYDCEFIEKV